MVRGVVARGIVVRELIAVGRCRQAGFGWRGEEDWQRRTHISFTLWDRLANHANATDCSLLSIICCLALRLVLLPDAFLLPFPLINLVDK
jgi:hypothetical protein